MFSFNDPEDELVFALFLPCAALLVAALAALALPVVACLFAVRLLSRAVQSLPAAARNVTGLMGSEIRGERVVF
jgi:hypothetical protein